jgi:hypothetical protein
MINYMDSKSVRLSGGARRRKSVKKTSKRLSKTKGKTNSHKMSGGARHHSKSKTKGSKSSKKSSKLNSKTKGKKMSGAGKKRLSKSKSSRRMKGGGLPPSRSPAGKGKEGIQSALEQKNEPIRELCNSTNTVNPGDCLDAAKWKTITDTLNNIITNGRCSDEILSKAQQLRATCDRIKSTGKVTGVDASGYAAMGNSGYADLGNVTNTGIPPKK